MGQPAGKGDGGEPGDAHREGAYIGKIHFHGIIYLFSQSEGHRGRGRSNQTIILLEGLFKFQTDLRPYLLCLEVVGIVVTFRQGIGSQHYSSFYLWAKPQPSGLTHVLPYILPLPVGKPILYPVVSSQVGRGLGRSNDVIAGKGIFGMGEGCFRDIGPQLFHLPDGILHGSLYLRVYSQGKVLLGNSDVHPSKIGGEELGIVRNAAVDRGGIPRVVSGDG